LWDAKLTSAVGARSAKPLTAELGLVTVGDLLSHYPRRYLDVDQVSTFAELRTAEGEMVTVVVKVGHSDIAPYRDRRTGRTAYRTEVEARFADGPVWMTFFDQARGRASGRIERQLSPGSTVVLSGRLTRNHYKRGRWELTHPEVTDPDDDPTVLLPVYPASAKLRSDVVRRAVRLVLDAAEDAPDLLPSRLREEHRLLGVAQALRWIHRPQDRRQAGAAARRLKFDEAFVTQIALAQRRHRQRSEPGRPRRGRSGGLLDAFEARMPFRLTPGQDVVEKEILADLAAEHPMRRLLQGEVGSGKTVVALRAMLRVVDSGGQAALLAPTEVLAQQHARSIRALLGPLADGGRLGAADEATRLVLLTGSTTGAARREALLEAASGAAGIVVGTHALLEEQVVFADLALVVVDEQHRFGVEQRAALAAKGADSVPHELVMTATPIPRTVAMTVFGDLETSALTELPAGRATIQTTVVPLAEAPGWIDRVWARVREEVERGHQVYVVCPRIAAGEAAASAWETGEEPPEDEPEVTSVGTGALGALETLAPALTAGALSGLALETLHGRMPPEEKERVMLAFSAGRVDVLVSTTVIEVGVDVANATMMVLLDADRFGVSQLHQLRGRVGRGGHPGLCLLVTGAAAGSAARARLDAVAATTDGFALAELDLELRREGNVLGHEQSGRRSDLRLVSVLRDSDIIEEARAAAIELVRGDPDLATEPRLASAVEDLHRRASPEYLDRA
jgi:ATP-dependent DNA helicase RecG